MVASGQWLNCYFWVNLSFKLSTFYPTVASWMMILKTKRIDGQWHHFISGCECYTCWYTQIKPLYTNICIVTFGCISSVFNLCIQTATPFFFSECLLKRINWEPRLVWCSPDWGRGGTGSGREAQRWQSAPANGGWLPGPPEGPGRPRPGLCLHGGT